MIIKIKNTKWFRSSVILLWFRVERRPMFSSLCNVGHQRMSVMRSSWNCICMWPNNVILSICLSSRLNKTTQIVFRLIDHTPHYYACSNNYSDHSRTGFKQVESIVVNTSIQYSFLSHFLCSFLLIVLDLFVNWLHQPRRGEGEGGRKKQRSVSCRDIPSSREQSQSGRSI